MLFVHLQYLKNEKLEKILKQTNVQRRQSAIRPLQNPITKIQIILQPMNEWIMKWKRCLFAWITIRIVKRRQRYARPNTKNSNYFEIQSEYNSVFITRRSQSLNKKNWFDW